MARSFLALAVAASFAGAAFAQPVPSPSPSPVATAPLPAGDGKRPKKNWDRDRDGAREKDRADRGPRESEDRGPREGGDPGRRPPLDDQGQQSARFKKWLDQLSPEERQHFQDNLKRWGQMGDGERKDWQQRAMDERERIKKIIDDTISQLGLNLDQDQREVFVLRYRQERRKIEEKLCAEINAKRETQVNEMLQRLKAEFSAPKPSASPSPAATPQ